MRFHCIPISSSSSSIATININNITIFIITVINQGININSIMSIVIIIIIIIMLAAFKKVGQMNYTLQKSNSQHDFNWLYQLFMGLTSSC